MTSSTSSFWTPSWRSCSTRRRASASKTQQALAPAAPSIGRRPLINSARRSDGAAVVTVAWISRSGLTVDPGGSRSYPGDLSGSGRLSSGSRRQTTPSRAGQPNLRSPRCEARTGLPGPTGMVDGDPVRPAQANRITRVILDPNHPKRGSSRACCDSNVSALLPRRRRGRARGARCVRLRRNDALSPRTIGRRSPGRPSTRRTPIGRSSGSPASD